MYLIKLIPNSEVLYILLPGASQGVNSGLMFNIYQKLIDQDKSVLAINYPFQERGEETSSGPEVLEEINALNKIFLKIDITMFTEINFICKSFGAILLSKYLKQNKDLESKVKNVFVLGYVKGDVDLFNINANLIVIQGEFDKFGNIEAVKEDFKNSDKENIKFIEVKDADHSFRDKDKNPVYENEVINILVESL